MRIDHPTDKELNGLSALWQQVFGDSEAYISTFFRLARVKKRCFCVTDGDAPVGALYWLDMWCRGEKLAYLYAIVTAPQRRGQGICKKLMNHTLNTLAASGYAGALLVPESPSLRQMYRKMGFEDGAPLQEFTVEGGIAPMALEELSGSAYFALRERSAGADAVIPGEEALALLSRYAGFYRGEDVLFIAARNGDTLCVTELLGSADAAPAIVNAFGCSRGIFRCPGGSEPFAMYRGLHDRFRQPGWFSTAFDEILP